MQQFCISCCGRLPHDIVCFIVRVIIIIHNVGLPDDDFYTESKDVVRQGSTTIRIKYFCIVELKNNLFTSYDLSISLFI
jgi:hypothetical protein